MVLPLWAVEYDFLGQPFRAFVSALTDATPTPAVSGVHHHPPWVLPAALTGGALAGGALGASAFGGGLMLTGGGAAVGSVAAMAGAYTDAMLQFCKWRKEGELRRREEGANVKWKVLIPPLPSGAGRGEPPRDSHAMWPSCMHASRIASLFRRCTASGSTTSSVC